MKKRLLALLMTFTMCLSLLPAGVLAAEEPNLQGSGISGDPLLDNSEELNTPTEEPEKAEELNLQGSGTSDTPLLIIGALNAPMVEPDLQGNGTLASAPYLINNSKELLILAEYVNAGNDCDGLYFRLMGNIGNDPDDADNAPITTSIGLHEETPFKGHLDGNGKTVTLNIDHTPFESLDDYETTEQQLYLDYRISGLVGFLGEGGEIKNVTTLGSVAGAKQNAGGICGLSDGTITNCSNYCSVTCRSSAGGVCGNNSGTITNCSNYGSMLCTLEYCGGIAGRGRGTITNCSNFGSVTGVNNSDFKFEYLGGVSGEFYGTMTNCSNSGTVTGELETGGVCGMAGNAILSGCSNSGDVSGLKNTSGVCGFANAATITDCSNSGNVNGTSYVGGVCGGTLCHDLNIEGMHFTVGSHIAGCSNYGSVTGNGAPIGGICAQLKDASIADCNNFGDVSTTGGGSIGGICGISEFERFLDTPCESLAITRCNNFGNVTVATNNSSVGGICGSNTFCSYFANYWYNERWVPRYEYKCEGVIISDCSNSGSIFTGNQCKVGGVCGEVNVVYARNGDRAGEGMGPDPAYDLINCYNSGGITAGDNCTVGGVCGKIGGEADYNYVTNCYNSGSVTMGSGCTAGGLCGNFGKGVMDVCFNSGSLTAGADSKVGGVYGTAVKGTGAASGEFASLFEYCYYDSTVFNGNAYGENVGSRNNSYGRSTEECQSAARDGLLDKLNAERNSEGLKWVPATISHYPVFHANSASARDLWCKMQENALYRSADGKISLTKATDGFALTLPGKAEETIPLSAFSGAAGENGGYTITDGDSNSYQFVKPGTDGFYINFTGADGKTKEKLLVRHVHGSWIYTADEGTLTATCGEDGCMETPFFVSLTLIAPADKAYDGKPVDEATFDSEGMTAWSDAIGSLPTIQYYLSGGTDPLTDLPTDTGIYAAVIKAGEATAQVYFAIWPEDVPAHVHTPKLVKGQAPTCTANGWTDYYECADNECGKRFSDPTCQNEITDFDTWKVGDGKIAATGHKAVNIPEKAATEAADGYKTYWYCPVCNSYYTDAACANKIDNIETWKTGDGKIEKLTEHEHNYGAATYIWNDGLTQCTAYRICTGEGCGNIELETVTAVKGESKITATFSNPAFATQTKTVEAPAHAHTPVLVDGQAPTCTADGWKDYYNCSDSTCNKRFSDPACTSEITDLAAWKSGDGKIAKIGHKAVNIPEQAATTAADGVKTYWYCPICNKYFKEAACENEITNLAAWKIGDGKIEKLSPEAPHNHNYSAATYIWNEDLTKCTAYKTCECGNAVIETVTTSIVENNHAANFSDAFTDQTKPVVTPEAPHEHSYGTATYIWNDGLTQCTAYKICECGHAVIETAETARNGNEITAAFKTDGFVKQTKTVTPPEAPHEHTFSDTWSRNACAHWHESTCDHDGYNVVKDVGGHDFGSGIAVAGGTKYICKTCGYEKTVADKEEEPCTHEHLTYINNGNRTHKVICSDCTETIKASEACVYDQNGGTKCVCGAKAPSKTDVKISVDVKEIKTKKFVGFLFWGTWKNVTTYTASIKTEAVGVKVTKVQYQLNGGTWTTGTCVSSDKPIMTLKVMAWDNTGNVHEYTHTK